MSQTEGVYEEDAQEAPFYFFSGPTILYYICVTIVFMFFLNISRFSILFNILTLAAILIQVIKFIFFYFHERIWNKSNFGQSLKKGLEE